MNEEKNILITGGAGFIGSSLATELCKSKYRIITLDNRTDLKNIDQIVEKIEHIQADVRNKSILNQILCDNNITGIVHLAAVSRVKNAEKNPIECVDVNINGILSLFESIQKSRSKPWIVFGSSREVYGEPKSLPVSESYPKNPINIYGYTKIIGEQLVRCFSSDIGLKSAILRFSNVYGNQRDILDRVIPRFVMKSLNGGNIVINGGNQLIDFTHIDDTIKGILQTIGYLESAQNHSVEDFHLLTGKGSTLQEIVQILSENIGRNINIKYDQARTYDVDRFVGDPQKAKEILGFTPKIFPDKGVPMTLNLYKEVFDL